MSRRSAGEGSIYRTPDGAGWMFSISVRSADGRGHKRIRRRAKTKAEAVRLMRAARTELDQYGSTADGTRTVEATVRDYLRMRRAQSLAPRTIEQDEWAAGLIRRGLGSRRLATVSVDDCDRFLEAVANGAFGNPMARPQLRRLRQKLVRVIENDQRRGVVSRNVAELAVVPDESPALIPRREPRALALVDLQRLLKVSEGVTRVLIDLSGRNGLRPAEARALRWTRVDLSSRTVRIDAQMNRKNDVVKAKTSRSLRSIRLDQESVDRLAEWRELQQDQRSHAGPAWSGNTEDLVATSLVGTALSQRNVHRSLVMTCDRAGIQPRISAYDLRHTAITLQVDNGHPAYRIADWAGTSERMIADVYRHKLDEVSDLGSIDDSTQRGK